MSASSGWSNSHSEPRLGANEIHVWRAYLDCETRVVQCLEAYLAPDEMSRAARFKFDQDRAHFIAARGILRVILGAYMHRDAAALTLTYGPEGKPGLKPVGQEASICFNLSHSHGLALYAFSGQREVGIDVEAIRANPAGEEIANRFFSAHEFAELQALPRELRDEGFFLCWTRKEAYIKARGSGMGIPLNSFDVSLTPGQPEILRSIDSNRWSLRTLQPAPGYVGAVVGEGKDWEMRLWDWADWNQTSGT